MDIKKYDRLMLVWTVLVVGSAMYYDKTVPYTLVWCVVLGTGLVGAIGAVAQYFYHHHLLEKKRLEEDPPQ